MTTTWEYTEAVADSMWGGGSRAEVAEEMGAEGWEFVESRKGSHSTWSDGEGIVFGIPCTIMVFKREAPRKPRRRTKKARPAP